MRRFSVLVGTLVVPGLLFLAGCSASARQDVAVAREYVQSFYTDRGTCEITRVERPEYVAVTQIPWGGSGTMKDRSAACAVRVSFTWQFEDRTTRDTWLVWVSSDHQAVGWGGTVGGDWRKYVRSMAKS